MSRPCVLLCEDQQQAVFVRRFLAKKGRQVLQVDFAPPGKGSGEQYVREQYPKQLADARKKKRALIVMIDGDKPGADDRLRQLEKACKERGVDNRGKAEPVAVFVPEPDIETWIYHLDSDLKGRLQRESDCKTAVQKLSDICEKGKPPADFPPSLSRACDEWQQFRKVAP